jgi:hypothetical protein
MWDAGRGIERPSATMEKTSRGEIRQGLRGGRLRQREKKEKRPAG